MPTLEIFILAFALSADAFSVGAAVGIRCRSAKQVFRLSFHFGLFQSLMSWGGALVGSLFLVHIQRYDHWVACALLVLIGGRMIYLARHDSGQQLARADITRGLPLIGLSLVVSLDALAAGVTLPAVEAPLMAAVLTIGVVSALATLIAMLLAGRISAALGRRCETVAGLVLIFLGLYIPIEHMDILSRLISGQ
ncbi:manganese efflux pump MntP family protein [bacterium]|nr:manganese efflux pump MntP family protein [bacterium]MBU1984525.1 manganese efflux pump MntP family protein [bacterium]